MCVSIMGLWGGEIDANKGCWGDRVLDLRRALRA